MVFLLSFEAHFSSALLYSVLVGHNSKTPVPRGGKETVKPQELLRNQEAPVPWGSKLYHLS